MSCHQALGYISGFSRAELPHVVERETVKEDGTVVRRCVSAGVHPIQSSTVPAPV